MSFTCRGRARVLVVLALAGPLFACIEEAPSVHPLFETTETLPLLAGVWETEGGDEPFRFEKEANEDNYHLVPVRPEKKVEKDADKDEPNLNLRFGRLNGELFVDIYARGEDLTAEKLAFPVHLFARVRLEPGRLEVSMIKQEWLKGAVRSGQVFLAHEDLGEDILITAPTSELQRALAQWTFLEEAFDSPVVFVHPVVTVGS